MLNAACTTSLHWTCATVYFRQNTEIEKKKIVIWLWSVNIATPTLFQRHTRWSRCITVPMYDVSDLHATIDTLIPIVESCSRVLHSLISRYSLSMECSLPPHFRIPIPGWGIQIQPCDEYYYINANPPNDNNNIGIPLEMNERGLLRIHSLIWAWGTSRRITRLLSTWSSKTKLLQWNSIS